jgi:rod shape-determining protein MreC
MANRYTRRRTLVLLVLTCVLLLTLSRRDNVVIDRARTGFGYVFRPFEGMARSVTRPVRNAWRGMTNYDKLEKENLTLRDELARQAGNSAAAEAFVREHNELLNLDQLPTGPEIHRVVAQVIGGSPRDDQQTVEINQGSRKGIRVGMPVTNGAGLIGKVTEVFPDGAVVRLVTDTQYILAVKIACQADVPGTVDEPGTTTPTGNTVGQPPSPRFNPTTTTTTIAPDVTDTGVETTTTTTTTTVPETTTTIPVTIGPDETAVETSVEETTTTLAPCERETGSIRGRGQDRRPIVGLLDDDVRTRDISVGDRVISAGGAESLAPQDLPIGVVARVIDRKGTSPEVEVELNADVDNLNFVQVLLYLPASELTP